MNNILTRVLAYTGIGYILRRYSGETQQEAANNVKQDFMSFSGVAFFMLFVLFGSLSLFGGSHGDSDDHEEEYKQCVSVGTNIKCFWETPTETQQRLYGQ